MANERGTQPGHMLMDRDALLRKIKACLRLAKSANVNESATALRQAQKLMAEHGLSETDVVDSDIRVSNGRTRSRGGDAPPHVWMLAVWVGCAFTCTAIQRAVPGATAILFVGRDARPEVASYSFTVLRRQLERDIAQHTRRVRTRASKVARTVSFGCGWVGAVRHTLGLQDLPEAERTAHEAFVGGVSTKKIDVRSGRTQDRLAGFVAGSQAALNPALQGSRTKALEHRHG